MAKTVKIPFMIKECLEAIKDVFFPPLCLYCGSKTPLSFLCQICEEKIEFFYPPLCRFCSQPIKDNKTNVCKECLSKTYSYYKIISITRYQEPMISLIHSFKYGNHAYLDRFLSTLMTKHLARIGFNPSFYDCVIPVPMHHLKLKERGYNQAALLAKLLANYFKLPFKDGIIYETRYKPSQTRLKVQARLENIKSAFLAKYNLEKKRIILVDDIFTTGATIESCARALKDKGAENILVITLSKTL